MTWWKLLLAFLGVLVSIFGLATILSINVPLPESVLVKITTPQELSLVKQGFPREIVFVSLSDSIYDTGVQTLTVKCHPEIGNLFISKYGLVENWLSTLGVQSQEESK